MAAGFCKMRGIRTMPDLIRNASIAQLVERDLAKVEVTSSNLVTRSKF